MALRGIARAVPWSVAAAFLVGACGIKSNREFQQQANNTDVQYVDGSPQRNYELILPQMRRCYTDTAAKFDPASGTGEISMSATLYAGIVGVVRVEPDQGRTKITTYTNYPLWRITHSAISLWVRGDKTTCPINLL
ncbi:MAG: hypothetical protein KIT16_24300 [Rhodospirillaceae bacterium]|nr:hypothetical protein [Rhodospirillaceae bacterium]